MLRTLPYTSTMPHPASMRVAGSDGVIHTSSQLQGRQEKLTRLHMEHNAKQLQRVGEASIYGPRNMRTSGLAAHPFKMPQGWATNSSRRDMNFTKEVPPPTPPPVVGGIPVDLIMQGLRRRMQQKGLTSLTNLEKFYRGLDKDGNGSLSFAEFRDGLLEQDILRSEAECAAIFGVFDEDLSGSMDYREFLAVVKGKLNDKRKAVVDEAFDFLDMSGNGTLDADDLKQRYATFAHPDVRAGIKTEEEVFSEFLSHFDTVCGDEMISKIEFEKYYENMSAVITSDAFFTAMVRNTWHLPGAQSGHCLKVHITRAAGTEDDEPYAWGHDIQKTVEIRPDLGLQRHDPRFFEETARRLYEMGFPDVAHIEVLGRY